MTYQPDRERHEQCGDECPVCSPELHAADPARLDRYAAAIYEGQNPGYRFADAHPDDKRACRWDAGHVIAADQAHAAEVRATALSEAADDLEAIDFHPNARGNYRGTAKAFAFRLRAKAAAARPDNTGA